MEGETAEEEEEEEEGRPPRLAFFCFVSFVVVRRRRRPTLTSQFNGRRRQVRAAVPRTTRAVAQSERLDRSPSVDERFMVRTTSLSLS